MKNPFKEKIFEIRSHPEFEKISLEVFHYQVENNPVYHSYIKTLGIQTDKINTLNEIPFLPVEFFKSLLILTGKGKIGNEFFSSGTTGTNKSRHCISDISIYEKSFLHAFELLVAKLKDLCILALLPGYLEQKGSSLVYMVNALIGQTGHPDSGFYLGGFGNLKKTLVRLGEKNQKILLFGVSFALLDFADFFDSPIQNTIVMETGGMKGRKKEITRDELHQQLCDKFEVSHIYSEYGMTEILSQAYSKGKGLFYSPPWMRILIRDVYDPFHYLPEGKTGGINIIDLANINSVCFIETQDLGRSNADHGFEVLGRFDQSDIRGCNLLI